MNNIQHVYFDVGGVLIFDFSGTNKWLEMKRDLGVTEKHDEFFDSIWKRHRDRICIDCDVDTISSEFERELGIQFPEGYSMLADFINRFEANPSLWPIVNLAEKKYTVGLLTNMYPRMLKAIHAKKLLPTVAWDAVVDSSVVGFQKPEEGMYKVAEEFAMTDPTSIFFIDNSVEHVEAAKKRGWQAMVYDPQNFEESNREIMERLSFSQQKAAE